MKLGELIADGHYVKAASIILWAALEGDHTNLPLIIGTAEAIARLLKVQEKLSSAQKNRTLDAAQKLITEIGIPIAGHFL
jgi:hypothetical protein